MDPRGYSCAITHVESSDPVLQPRNVTTNNATGDSGWVFQGSVDSTSACAVTCSSDEIAMRAAIAASNIARLRDALINGDLAAVNAVLADAPTLLNKAVFAQRCKLLLSAGVSGQRHPADSLGSLPDIDFDTWCDSRLTALHAACIVGHLSIAKALLRRGALVNLSNQDSTPLIAACSHGNPALANLIIKLTPRHLLDFTTLAGNSAMTVAATSGHTNIIRLLLRAGADPNYQYKGGVTALHQAARHGRLETATLLLKRGATQLPSTDGSPLYLACLRDDAPMFRLLMKTISPEPNQAIYLMRSAIVNHAAECMRCLLKSGVPVNPESPNAYVPLIHALQYRDLDIVRMLLEHGANADYVVRRSDSIKSPLSIAVLLGLPGDAVLLLLVAMGPTVILAESIAQLLIQTALTNQDYRIINELALKNVIDGAGRPLNLAAML